MKLELIKNIKPVEEVVNEKQGGMDQWVSTEQAAEIMGVDVSRVRQLKGEGRLTPQNPTASDLYFKRADVEAEAKNPRERTGRPKGSKTKNKSDDVKEGFEVEIELLEGAEAHTHEVIEKGSKKVVGKYKSAEAARRGRDKKDNAYGSYKYSVRKIGEETEAV